jgi:hypothetical protein
MSIVEVPSPDFFVSYNTDIIKIILMSIWIGNMALPAVHRQRRRGRMLGSVLSYLPPDATYEISTDEYLW